MPPFYYRDLAYYIKTQNQNIPNLQNKTKYIKVYSKKALKTIMYLGKKMER